jgi:pimeloyl-ACP methyl ester carboxylesterase
LRGLARLAPSLAAALAERLFFTPPRLRAAPADGLRLTAEPLRLTVDGVSIAAWRWGRGPTVALIHGWGGRSLQLGAFVEPLLERGLSVVAFDAPGHGRSGGRLSSAPQFARALEAVAAHAGPIHGVVAHSLGATAAALALRRGLPLGRLVFVGPPADPPAWAAGFARRLGLTPALIERMRARSERRIGMSWTALNLPAFAGDLDAPLLVVHDRDDVEVPLRDGAAIAAAWPGAALEVTSGLGHQRVLRHPAVIARTVAFLAEGARCPACGIALADGHSGDQCRLERELFDRDGRWSGRPAA